MPNSSQFRKATDLLKANDRVNLKEMCRELGISYAAFNHYKRGGVTVDDDVVNLIAGKYPQFREYLDSGEEPGGEPQASGDRWRNEMKEMMQFYEKKLSLEHDRYNKLNDAYIRLVDELIAKKKE